MKRYRLGLVFGKFSPLHLGHEWLVDQAARQCERLLVLSYTKPELPRCDAATRGAWLAERFPAHQTLAFDDAWLAAACTRLGLPVQAMPGNDADESTQRRFLAWLLDSVLQRRPEAIFTSEAYGPGCANALAAAFGHAVGSVSVDPARVAVPISATRIRNDPHAHTRWLSPAVRAAYVARVVLLGGESSGKTTLAAALAAHYGTAWIAEYGRELWERKGGALVEPDLLQIGLEQVRREEAGLRRAQRYLVCDTSPLTTMGYSLWMYGRADPALATLAERRYDAVVLCSPDIPFEQDGGRRGPDFRAMQHEWYRSRLAGCREPLIEAHGDLPQRLAQVTAWLDALGLPRDRPG